MLIAATKKAWLDALFAVQNTYAGTRPSLPVLASILITVNEEKVAKISATNIERDVTSYFLANESEPGTILIPAARFIDIVKNATGDIKIKGEKTKATISFGQSRFVLQGIDPQNFPAKMVFSKKKLFIEPEKLYRLLKGTAFAMPRNDTRNALNGVLLEMQGNEIVAVATNGMRLAAVRSSLKTAVEKPRRVIIPDRTIPEILRLLAGTKEDVVIGDADSHWSFKIGNVVISTRLVDGEFPNYKRILEGEPHKIAITLDVSEMLSAIRQIGCITDDNETILSIDKDQIVLKGEDKGVSEGDVKVNIKYDGDALTLHLNREFLSDYFSFIEKGTVEAKISTPESPVFFVNDGSTYVVMPIKA